MHTSGRVDTATECTDDGAALASAGDALRPRRQIWHPAHLANLQPARVPCPPGLVAEGQCVLPVPDRADLTVQLLEFDASRFVPALFDDWNIVCPASVASSVSKRQAEFFFGRLAARRAIVQTGASIVTARTNIAIGAMREPCWPSGLSGSISHTGNVAAAVALKSQECRGVGIDIERVVGPAVADAVKETVANAAEWAMLRSLTGMCDEDELLTIVFSSKESLFKGAFVDVKRYFDFNAACLVSLDVDRRIVRLRLAETLSPHFVCGHEFEITFDFVKPDTVMTCFVW